MAQQLASVLPITNQECICNASQCSAFIEKALQPEQKADYKYFSYFSIYSMIIVAASIATLYITMIIVKRISKKLYTPEQLFAKLLHPHSKNPGLKRMFHLEKNVSGIRFVKAEGKFQLNYKVPSSICMKANDDGEPILELGGVIALADELTTMTAMACDRSHRPGVSVLLAGERCCESMTIKPDTTVTIVTRICKIGRLLGNVELDVLVPTDPHSANSSHVKVFSIRHIKYIDMGIGWSRLGELLPLYIRLFGTYPAAASIHSDGIYSSLGLTNTHHPHNGSTSVSPFSNPVTKSEIDVAGSAQFKMSVNKRIENPFGNLHGGALSYAFHRAVHEFCSSLDRNALSNYISKPSRFSLSSLEIHYLRPNKHSLVLNVSITSVSSLCESSGTQSCLMILSITSHLVGKGSKSPKLSASGVCKVVWH